MKTTNTGELVFEGGLKALSLAMIALVVGIFITICYEARLSISEFGVFSFLIESDWTPNYDEVGGSLGGLSFAVGTVLTSLCAILISLPFSIAIAIFLGNFSKNGKLASFFASMVELLAGIPSVIYGFWAIFYLVPIMESFKVSLGLGDNGFGLFTAALVLAVMIIPYSASMAREVITMTPTGLRESAYALGATRFEVLKDIVIPYCKSGIFAGIILSLGRALGETMAVTMVVGNLNEVPNSIFDMGNTMASLLANEFNEASEDMYVSALVEVGMILFLITTSINLLGKTIIKKLSRS